MQINWTVRIKNPVWWAQLACSIVLPLIIGMGASWEEMTSWATLGSTILGALQNPVVVVAMLASVWATITDPTTKGLGDSAQAMTYDEPKAA